MDLSLSNPSRFLQDRLRDRKGDPATRHVPRHSNFGHDGRLNSGRDDAIFDIDDDSPPAKATQPTFYSSPGGPSSITHAHRRRTAGSRVSSGAVSKSMGARELDEHLDKLSKQNFDLKLEVFHRREKCDELERRIKDVQKLEDDNLELRDINEELFLELENRDRAVDEAVVMITDLEAKVKELEEQLSDVRAITAVRSQVPSESGNSIQQPRPQRPLVSTDVSARMLDLNSPAKSEPVRHIPSFIENPEPNTDALRRLFVQGDKRIRAIPSYASLMSKGTARDDEEEPIAEPRSPQLSVLSERELGSVYGHEMLDEKPSERAVEQTRLPVTHSSESSSDYRSRRTERTTDWVANTDSEPSKGHQATQRSSKSEAAYFQSLGGILHQPAASTDSPTRARKPRPQAALMPENKSTPPLGIPPLYGPNAFPPTPDTMNTHSLNRSSSSIIRDKSLNDHSNMRSASYASLLPGNYLPQLSQAASQANTSARNSLLPKEFEAYGDSDEENDLTTHGAQDFGVALYQTYSSDDGFSNYGTPMTHRHASSTGARSPGSPGTRPMFSPSQMSAVSPRRFDSRRKSFGDPAVMSASRPRSNSFRGVSEPPEEVLQTSPPRKGSVDMLSRYRAQRLEQDRHSDKAIYPESSPTRPGEAALASRVVTPGHLRPLPPLPPSSAPSASKTQSSPVRSSSRPRRAESLRQRLSRFARRNSQSSAPGVIAAPLNLSEDGKSMGTESLMERATQGLVFRRKDGTAMRPVTSDTASLPGHATQSSTQPAVLPSSNGEAGGDRVGKGRVSDMPAGGYVPAFNPARVANIPLARGDGMWPAGRAFEALDQRQTTALPSLIGTDGQRGTFAADGRYRVSKVRRGSEGTVPMYI